MLGDDVISAAQALPFTFDYPGGSTSTIRVDSNGSVNLNGAGVSQIGGGPAALLTSTVHRLSPSMQDLFPDGATNVADLALLQANLSPLASDSPAAVPEPSSAILAIAGFAWLTRFRRSERRRVTA